MAQGRKSSKRYWPVMLLAAAVAETAHAPLMGGARAAGQMTREYAKTTEADKPPSEVDKKLKPPLTLAVGSDPRIQNEKPRPKWEENLFLPLPPPRLAAIHPELEGVPAQSISLLHTGAPDASDAAAGSSGNGGDAVLAALPPGNYATPVGASPLSDPVAGGTDGLPSNGNPVIGLTQTITAVPEPGGLLLMMGSAMLLSRRRSRV